MKDTKLFIEMHTPFRGRYSAQYQGTDWVTRTSFLGDFLIEKALNGEITLGYYQSSFTRVLGIDIDDHSGKGWEHLQGKYQEVVSRIDGLPPSLVNKSPRGLHLYYYFEYQMPTVLLSKLAKSKLSGIKDVEIKPTMNQSLRIPSNKTLLDSETLKPTRKKMGTLIEKAPRYHYAQIFPDHDVVFEELMSSQGYFSSERECPISAQLIQQEQEIVPEGFIPQETNDQLLQLENLYRTNGLSVDEAYERCQRILERSDQYYGELKDKPKRLFKRLEFMYSKNPHKARKVAEKNIDPQNEAIIENIVARSPFSKQRDKPLRYFLQQLLKWKRYQDDILKNPEQSSLWEYKYRFYLHNRKRGYYPLPFSLMRRWNHRYHEILRFLLEIEFLDTAPFSYSVSSGICKYYKIKQDNFSLPTMILANIGAEY